MRGIRRTRGAGVACMAGPCRAGPRGACCRARSRSCTRGARAHRARTHRPRTRGPHTGRTGRSVVAVGDGAVVVASQHSDDGSFSIDGDRLNALADDRQVVFARCQPGELVNPILVSHGYQLDAAGMAPDDDLDVGERLACRQRSRTPARHAQAGYKRDHQARQGFPLPPAAYRIGILLVHFAAPRSIGAASSTFAKPRSGRRFLNRSGGEQLSRQGQIFRYNGLPAPPAPPPPSAGLSAGLDEKGPEPGVC